jgi:hypothetical protein
MIEGLSYGREVLWVDENGLLRPHPHFAWVLTLPNGQQQRLVGNGLLVGSNHPENCAPARSAVEDVRKAVRFVGAQGWAVFRDGQHRSLLG